MGAVCWVLPPEGARAALAEVLETLVQEGKVKQLGVSNFLPHQFDLLQSRLSSPLVANQIEASLLHSVAMFDGQLDHCQQHRDNAQ